MGKTLAKEACFIREIKHSLRERGIRVKKEREKKEKKRFNEILFVLLIKRVFGYF